MQEGNITTNINFNIGFTFPELIAMKILTWSCHVGDYVLVRYYTILDRDILTLLGLNLKLSYHAIKAHDLHLKLLMAPLVDMGAYAFKKYIYTGKIKSE